MQGVPVLQNNISVTVNDARKRLPKEEIVWFEGIHIMGIISFSKSYFESLQSYHFFK